MSYCIFVHMLRGGMLDINMTNHKCHDYTHCAIMMPTVINLQCMHLVGYMYTVPRLMHLDASIMHACICVHVQALLHPFGINTRLHVPSYAFKILPVLRTERCMFNTTCTVRCNVLHIEYCAGHCMSLYTFTHFRLCRI